jgi:hypothetical protein
VLRRRLRWGRLSHRAASSPALAREFDGTCDIVVTLGAMFEGFEGFEGFERKTGTNQPSSDAVSNSAPGRIRICGDVSANTFSDVGRRASYIGALSLSAF